MITGEFHLVEFVVEVTRPGTLEEKVLRRFTAQSKADAFFDRCRAEETVSSVGMYRQVSHISRVKLR